MTHNHLAEPSFCANTASRTSSTTLSGVEAPDVTPRVNDPSGSHSFESHCTGTHADIVDGDETEHSKFRVRAYETKMPVSPLAIIYIYVCMCVCVDMYSVSVPVRPMTFGARWSRLRGACQQCQPRRMGYSSPRRFPEGATCYSN